MREFQQVSELPSLAFSLANFLDHLQCLYNPIALVLPLKFFGGWPPGFVDTSHSFVPDIFRERSLFLLIRRQSLYVVIVCCILIIGPVLRPFLEQLADMVLRCLIFFKLRNSFRASLNLVTNGCL